MTDYTINDRNGETRIEGTIDPDPAFNGGTITDGIRVTAATAGSDLFTGTLPDESGNWIDLADADRILGFQVTGAGASSLTWDDSTVTVGVDLFQYHADDQTYHRVFRIQKDGQVEIANAGTNSRLGFFGHANAVQQTGVAVTAAGIHAALVAYGLITT